MNMNDLTHFRLVPGPDDTLRETLPNGITVLARHNPESLSVVVNGYLAAGSLFDPLDRLGLAHFTALSLMRGTRQHDFQAIYDTLESAGASLGYAASVHHVGFGGRALAEDLPLLLSLLAETLRSPVFPADEVERLRAQLLTGLAIRDQDTADRAEMAFEEIIFPDHPYGRPTDGTQETVARITREDIEDFHRRCYGPSGMVIVVVGAVEEKQALDMVINALGDWNHPAQATPPPLPELRPLESAVRRHIFLPGKVQTDLIMGCLGPGRTSPDYLAASLGNNILGQFGMMGRIGEVVREQEGLAYDASASLNGWIAGGSWEISAGVHPDHLERAIDLILKEVRRFIAEPVTPQELADSQASYIGRLPLTLESNAGVASALLKLERFQLGLDYYRRYPAMVKSVTPEQILEVARRYLQPERFAIVSAGPALE